MAFLFVIIYLEVVMAEKKWIQKAIQHPGRIKEALDVPEDETIHGKEKMGKLRKLAEKSGSLGAAARLALRLKGEEFKK